MHTDAAKSNLSQLGLILPLDECPVYSVPSQWDFHYLNSSTVSI